MTRAGAIATALSVATVVAWVNAAGGAPWPRPLALLMVVGALASWSAVGWRLVRQPWQRADPGLRWAILAVTALTVVATTMRLGGIDWELGGGSLRDESYYVELAQRVNQGALLPQAFHYGHLVYYLGAMWLWAVDLVPGLRSGLEVVLARGAVAPAESPWLLLRALAAVLGGLTVLPVAAAAYRLAGPLAAVAASAVLTFSTLHARIVRQFIAEGPSAFFAALAFAAAVVLVVEPWATRDRDRRRWILAGVAAGLAAACKYPAGVVAVAIVIAAARRWWRDRSGVRELLLAGAASIAAFLGAMPALVLSWREALSGEGKDLLFGVRQYRRGGWLGVQPDSVGWWYVERLVTDLGIALAVVAVLGIALVPRDRRGLWAAVLVWPVGHLALLGSMSMAVERTLTPLLPGLFVVVGASLGVVLERAKTWRPAFAGVVAAVVALTLVVPARSSLGELATLLRPSTREVAAAWIVEHVPAGSKVLLEWYGPKLDEQRYTLTTDRFVTRRTLEEIANGDFDVVVLSETSYARFLDGPLEKPHHRAMAERYRVLLALEPTFEIGWQGGRHRGPRIVVLEAADLRTIETTQAP